MEPNIDNSEKIVLIKLETTSGSRNRPVLYSGGRNELISATKIKFSDIVGGDSEIYLQILDDSWGDGIFVDLSADQEIPSRSVIKAVEIKNPTVDVSTLSSPMAPTRSLSSSSDGFMPTPSSSSSDGLGPGLRVQSHLTLTPSGLSLAKSKEPPLPALEADKDLDEKEIRAQATIYKKEDLRPLSSYQKRINEVAQEMCVKNPTMLRNRQKLLEVARATVGESYQFKKGKSRSKHLDSSTTPLPKRKKINQTARLARMKTLEDDIKNLKERISYKEKRRQMAEDSKNYRVCDELTEEIGNLSRESRQHVAELQQLSKKEKHSKIYYRRKSKSKSSASQSASGETCSSHLDSASDVSHDMSSGGDGDGEGSSRGSPGQNQDF